MGTLDFLSINLVQSSKMSEEQEKNNVAAEAVTNGNEDEFSLDNLKSHFESCIGEDGSVYIDKYLLGYDELYKFLNLLGTVFGWVATDVWNKMETVRNHRKGENSAKYETIQSMLAFEIESNMIKPKAKDSSTGTRNLLRYIVLWNISKLFLMVFQHWSPVTSVVRCPRKLIRKR